MIRWVLVREKVCMWCTQEHLLSQLVQAVLHEWFQLAQVQPVRAAVLRLQTNDSLTHSLTHLQRNAHPCFQPRPARSEACGDKATVREGHHLAVAQIFIFFL